MTKASEVGRERLARSSGFILHFLSYLFVLYNSTKLTFKLDSQYASPLETFIDCSLSYFGLIQGVIFFQFEREASSVTISKLNARKKKKQKMMA